MQNNKRSINNNNKSYILSKRDNDFEGKMTKSKKQKEYIVFREFLGLYNYEELVGIIIKRHIEDIDENRKKQYKRK